MRYTSLSGMRTIWIGIRSSATTVGKSVSRNGEFIQAKAKAAIEASSSGKIVEGIAICGVLEERLPHRLLGSALSTVW